MATFYGVWAGKQTGVFATWGECSAQVNGFKGAQYRKITANTLQEAQAIFDAETYQAGVKPKVEDNTNVVSKPMTAGPSIPLALTVDGADNGVESEYQAVWYPSREPAFKSKVFQGGTNNIAEFLGLVDAIRYLHTTRKADIIYTDSMTALAWVRNRRANTTAGQTGRLTDELKHLIGEAEAYLLTHDISDIQLQKWDTKSWGEIPADFGRK